MHVYALLINKTLIQISFQVQAQVVCEANNPCHKYVHGRMGNMQYVSLLLTSHVM